MDETDHALLRRFGQDGDHDAFTEIVRRHLPVVRGTALRIAGNPSAAEDIAQIVFTHLAGRWRAVSRSSVLAAWLHTDTRYVALQWLRSERRRLERDRKCDMPQESESDPEWEWSKLRPWIDEALERLTELDRVVVLLRYFEQRDFRDIADRLGLKEDAARMRLTRAVERLGAILRRQGLTTTASALAAALSAHAVTPVAPSMVQAVAAGALSGANLLGLTAATGTGSFSSWMTTTLTMTKTNLSIGAALVAAVLVPTGILLRFESRWTEESRRFGGLLEDLRGRQTANEDRLSELLKEVAASRERWKSIDSLKAAWDAEHAEAKRKSFAAAPVEGRKETAVPQVPSEAKPVAKIDPAWFMGLPAPEKGRLLGRHRLPPVPLDAAGLEALKDYRELAGKVRPELDSLEDRPAEFADFQVAFIESVTGIQDSERLGRIRDLIRNTYEEAVGAGLVASARPEPGPDLVQWGLKRDALDRRATREVQALFDPSEREKFDNAFLGVMGIDVGIGDGMWHRLVGPDGQVQFPSEESGAKAPESGN